MYKQRFSLKMIIYTKQYYQIKKYTLYGHLLLIFL